MKSLHHLTSSLNNLQAISLEQLNASMSLMERIDRKYLTSIQHIPQVIQALSDRYYVLQIQDKTIFSYDNVYMDTVDYNFYHQHQSGQKPRTKVRSRRYVDSDLAFFEFKQKNDEVTRKFRYQYELEDHGKITNEMIKFYDGLYQSFYNTESDALIFPSIATTYQRCTLCSKNNDERVTIDFNIGFRELRSGKKQAQKVDTKPLQNIAIIESKSTHIDCGSHQVLSDLGIDPTNKCSKYCLGIIYNKLSKATNAFDGTLELIQQVQQQHASKHIHMPS